MTKRRRPSLVSLSPQAESQPKATTEPSPGTRSGEPATAGPSGRPAASGEAGHGPTLLQVQVNGPGWSEMNGLASELGAPVQVLMAEAFNDLLIKHGRPPVVEAVTGELSAMPASRVNETPPTFPPTFPLWPALADPWWWHRTITAPLLAAWGRDRSERK